ncbi:uncharacterized protein LY79DRAFT_579387 [Colletotrichum navitas]|uniref:Uncharacterized protein n=1 Tax=Colletotrichum navitas TaxID=681940 RepID=A0AAD8Q0S8_9PEZI|nr:uncharacterized protein LY79DRAFT_579387 [Colletotrichum navitas]KAK1593276.1 hypothetical protein LY79DRAFT_579387 [Colletotrichum navitas]
MAASWRDPSVEQEGQASLSSHHDDGNARNFRGERNEASDKLLLAETLAAYYMKETGGLVACHGGQSGMVSTRLWRVRMNISWPMDEERVVNEGSGSIVPGCSALRADGGCASVEMSQKNRCARVLLPQAHRDLGLPRAPSSPPTQGTVYRYLPLHSTLSNLAIGTSLVSSVIHSPLFLEFNVSKHKRAAVVPGTASPCTCAPCKHTRPSSPSTGISAIRGNGDSNGNAFITNPRLHSQRRNHHASAAPGVRPAAALGHTEPTHGRLTCQVYYQEICTIF